MLKALLAGKLDGVLARSPQAIEDLVTAVVLGTCSYCAPQDALLPFLGRARTERGLLLGEHLDDVVGAHLEFWPTWHDIVAPSARDDAGDVLVAGGEPDVLVELEHRDGSTSLLVIEAKVLSGKSSGPSDGPVVTDQLAKYWAQLEQRAEDTRALGVVYLTTSVAMPEGAFNETRRELHEKGLSEPPLYWLSWRAFIDAVDPEGDPMLRDLDRLLRRWGMTEVRMAPWPTPVAASIVWRFTIDWGWPAPPQGPAWSITPSGKEA